MFALAALMIFHLSPPSARLPYREPQVASSAHLTVLAFGSGKSIYVATSTNEGKSFSKPMKVVEAQVLPLSRHRGPRVIISRRTIVVTAVVGHAKTAGPHAYGLPSDANLFAWRSTDGGKTWSKGVRINDVPGAAREGLHTLATDGHGTIFAAWLDLRHKGTQLYGAYSSDSGASWSAKVLLYQSPDGTICQCCAPSAAFSKNGTLDVMWRNCLGGARNLYLIHSIAGRKFSRPQKLGVGTWKINMCPMDGGGVTFAGGEAITAWRREDTIFMDKPGQPEMKLGEGRDVAVAASRGRIYVVWINGTRLELWTSGKHVVLANEAALPTVTAIPGGGSLAAWEESGGISLRRLP